MEAIDWRAKQESHDDAHAAPNRSARDASAAQDSININGSVGEMPYPDRIGSIEIAQLAHAVVDLFPELPPIYPGTEGNTISDESWRH